MKMFVTLMLISGFVGANAQAEVGRNDGPKVDCSKVIQSIQEQMKRNRPAGDTNAPAPGTDPNSGTAK